MDNFNLINENLKNSLVQIISNSNLPVANVYFIVKDIFRDIENNYYNQISKEMGSEEQNIQEEQISTKIAIPLKDILNEENEEEAE